MDNLVKFERFIRNQTTEGLNMVAQKYEGFIEQNKNQNWMNRTSRNDQMSSHSIQ